jgi:hypothetical protein
MALIQSLQAQEREPVAVVLTAGVETVNIYDVDLSAGLTAASDEVEVALLPANAKLTGITVIGASTGSGETADVGIMSGEWRDTGDRTLDSVLMNDVTIHNTSAVGAVDTLTDVAMSDKNRSIGMTFSADIAAGSGKSVKMIVRTIMG